LKERRWKYSDAGVDIRKIRKGQREIADLFGRTFVNREGKLGNVLENIGHYSGLIDIGKGTALALHTDGVGTKVLIAQMIEQFDTIGIDCVAMNVNDVICVGAEPIAFLDYIAMNRFDEDLVRRIGKGLVVGANEASVAIVGGETAVMPDVIDGWDEKAFDLVGMVIGVVPKDQVVTGDRIKVGDIVVGVESSGIHSNGMSLARSVLIGKHNQHQRVTDMDSSTIDELLKPTRIYVKPVLEILRSDIKVSGLAHITGGAFSKMTRLVRNRKIGFELNQMPVPPPLFQMIQRKGMISTREMYRTFNMGIGFCVITSESEIGDIEKTFHEHRMKTHVIGKVVDESGVYVNDIHVD
jgi:phosphoribosylformylglycinamidine cyclo-ligase